MKTLLVTGGIGSGKSEVCRFLAGRGALVYDCDTRAKALYDEQPALAQAVSCALGGGLVADSGKLDLASLAARIFADQSARQKVEALVHPAVLADVDAFKAQAEASGAPLAVIESALALRAPGLLSKADAVLLVDAPEALRVQRACRRSGLTPEQAQARVAAQRSAQPQNPEFTIINDNTLEHLHSSIEGLLKQFLGN